MHTCTHEQTCIKITNTLHTHVYENTDVCVYTPAQTELSLNTYSFSSTYGSTPLYVCLYEDTRARTYLKMAILCVRTRTPRSAEVHTHACVGYTDGCTHTYVYMHPHKDSNTHLHPPCPCLPVSVCRGWGLRLCGHQWSLHACVGVRACVGTRVCVRDGTRADYSRDPPRTPHRHQCSRPRPPSRSPHPSERIY